MTKLTLPIEIGKKYVRRDGVVVTAEKDADGDCLAFVGNADDDRARGFNFAWRSTGTIRHYSQADYDLISDYIEPAKGHPHAEKMAEFAQDARETETPWERWEWLGASGTWHPADSSPAWKTWVEYRRKATITPDPHAASMLLYAQDAAETDRAWEGWEYNFKNQEWIALNCHPAWDHNAQYRRKAQS